MIQPSEIQTKVFTKAVRGYSAEEVDEFLDQLTVDLENLLRENDQLKQTIAEQKEKMDKYKSQEGAMLNTLEAAKSLMNDISASAEKRADILIRNAELDADLKLREARETVQRLKEEELNLNHKVLHIKTRLKSFLSSELERLDDMGEDLLEAIKAAEDVPSTLTPALDSSSEKFLNDLTNLGETVVFKEPIAPKIIETQAVDTEEITRAVDEQTLKEEPAIEEVVEFTNENSEVEEAEVEETEVAETEVAEAEVEETEVEETGVAETEVEEPSFNEIRVNVSFDTPVVPFGFSSMAEEAQEQAKEAEKEVEESEEVLVEANAAEELSPVYEEATAEVLHKEVDIAEEEDAVLAPQADIISESLKDDSEELNLEDIFSEVKDAKESIFSSAYAIDPDTAAFLEKPISDEEPFKNFDAIPEDLKNTLSHNLSQTKKDIFDDEDDFEEPEEQAELQEEKLKGDFDFESLGRLLTRFRGKK